MGSFGRHWHGCQSGPSRTDWSYHAGARREVLGGVRSLGRIRLWLWFHVACLGRLLLRRRLGAGGAVGGECRQHRLHKSALATLFSNGIHRVAFLQPYLRWSNMDADHPFDDGVELVSDLPLLAQNMALGSVDICSRTEDLHQRRPLEVFQLGSVPHQLGQERQLLLRALMGLPRPGRRDIAQRMHDSMLLDLHLLEAMEIIAPRQAQNLAAAFASHCGLVHGGPSRVDDVTLAEHEAFLQVAVAFQVNLSILLVGLHLIIQQVRDEVGEHSVLLFSLFAWGGRNQRAGLLCLLGTLLHCQQIDLRCNELISTGRNTTVLACCACPEDHQGGRLRLDRGRQVERPRQRLAVFCTLEAEAPGQTPELRQSEVLKERKVTDGCDQLIDKLLRPRCWLPAPAQLTLHLLACCSGIGHVLLHPWHVNVEQGALLLHDHAQNIWILCIDHAALVQLRPFRQTWLGNADLATQQQDERALCFEDAVTKLAEPAPEDFVARHLDVLGRPKPSQDGRMSLIFEDILLPELLESQQLLHGELATTLHPL
mmetsp:Transcript_60948/g.145197  ORF Transcript_60948/g.145197 Transcript_60948/m.145197 type:complete len:540 (+) Transcript_60948:619-2238(+)